MAAYNDMKWWWKLLYAVTGVVKSFLAKGTADYTVREKSCE